MRITRLALLATVYCSSVFASGVTIKLSGNQDPACLEGDICITNDSFDLLTDTNGGGFFNAVNEQGNSINTLDFNLEYTDPGCPVSSSTTPSLSFDSAFLAFASGSLDISQNSVCDPTLANVADYTLILNFQPGIPNNFLFEINLNSDGSTDPSGSGGWLPNENFPVDTSIPEPGTLAAGASGLLLLSVGVYRRARRGSASPSTLTTQA